MTYEIEFYGDAFDEWHRLDASVRDQFKKKLAKRVEDPLTACDGWKVVTKSSYAPQVSV